MSVGRFPSAGVKTIMHGPATTYLIAGLGNPGSEYERTRHNAGFMLVERLAERWRAEWRKERKFKAAVAAASFGGRKILLVKPQTFMNLSGAAVVPLMRFYRVTPANLLVVVDDANLALGRLRLRNGGSSGGHHGLDSVESHAGSRDWSRLRLGIGRKDGLREISGHVLGKFEEDELNVVSRVLEHAACQTECWLQDGAEQAMNRFNGPIPGLTEEKEK
jgi:PTH1 family peptidyl-tRNA hydrolase